MGCLSASVWVIRTAASGMGIPSSAMDIPISASVTVAWVMVVSVTVAWAMEVSVSAAWAMEVSVSAVSGWGFFGYPFFGFGFGFGFPFFGGFGFGNGFFPAFETTSHSAVALVATSRSTGASASTEALPHTEREHGDAERERHPEHQH